MPDTYLEVKNDLNNWLLEAADDTYISDLAHNLINRARRKLNRMYPWDGLVKRSLLTVSGGDATLPTDIARIMAVYQDADGDGEADRYYYRDGDHSTGYKMTTTYDKDTGRSRVITFRSGSDFTDMYIMYLQELEDFANDEVNTQYCYFPGSLLYVQAQVLNMIDQEVVDGSYNVLMNHLMTEINDHIKNDLVVNREMKMYWRDNFGTEITPQGMDMNGGTVSNVNNNAGYSPDYDRGGGWNYKGN